MFVTRSGHTARAVTARGGIYTTPKPRGVRSLMRCKRWSTWDPQAPQGRQAASVEQQESMRGTHARADAKQLARASERVVPPWVWPAQTKLKHPSQHMRGPSPHPNGHILRRQTRRLLSAHRPRNHDTPRHRAHGSDLRQRGTHLTEIDGERERAVEGPPRPGEASEPRRPQ